MYGRMQAIVDWCDATGGSSTAFDFTTKVRALGFSPLQGNIRGEMSQPWCIANRLCSHELASSSVVVQCVQKGEYVNSTSCLALQAVLQDALEKGEYWRLRDAQGKPPGVVGWWPSRAVTFLDNHDTGEGL